MVHAAEPVEHLGLDDLPVGLASFEHRLCQERVSGRTARGLATPEAVVDGVSHDRSDRCARPLRLTSKPTEALLVDQDLKALVEGHMSRP